MAHYWKESRGCLLLKGGRFIYAGQEIPEGGISPERLKSLIAKGKIGTTAPVVAPAMAAAPPPALAPVSVSTVGAAGPVKRGPGRPPKAR